MAACQGWPQIVRLLCQGGADADRRHHSGLDVQVDGPLIMRSCALHFAAARAHAEVVRVLLEQGADCNRLDDGSRRPAELCNRRNDPSGHVRRLLHRASSAAAAEPNGTTPAPVTSQGPASGIQGLPEYGCRHSEAEVSRARSRVHQLTSQLTWWPGNTLPLNRRHSV